VASIELETAREMVEIQEVLDAAVAVAEHHYRFERTVAEAQQIEVACRPIGLIRPQPQQHGALEREAVAAIGHAEAVQEALQAVARKQGLMVIAGLPCPVEQARGDGGGQVGPAGHAIASR
jgi:hypothetical protein